MTESLSLKMMKQPIESQMEFKYTKYFGLYISKKQTTHQETKENKALWVVNAQCETYMTYY